MKAEGMQKAQMLGMVAAVLVLMSLLLPWMDMTVDVLGVASTTPYTGLDIYQEGDQDVRIYPVLAIVSSALAILLFHFHRRGTAHTLVGIVLGSVTVASSLMVYWKFLEYEASSFMHTITVSISYGMMLAMVAGAAIAIAAVWDK
ncbi:MAG: hypothetical protein WCY65_01615 [Candidatus Methanomethylophilaceae archaeon]